METLVRHWNILQLIPRSPRRISPREILDALSARGLPASTLRTIQRDLNLLSVPFQLVSDGCRPSGWSWAKDAPVYDLPGMDPRQALTLKMVQKFLAQMLPGTCIDYLSPSFERATSVLNGLPQSALGYWPDKIGVARRAQPLLPPQMSLEILGMLYDALLADQKLNIRYHGRYDEKPKDAEINPLGIVWAERVVYLVCTFWSYEGVKHIPVHRIKAATALDDTSARPDDFNLQDYIRSGAFGFTTADSDVIKLRAYFSEFAAFHLHETPLSEDQILTPQDDGDILVEASVLKNSQLTWWLLGFGDEIEVLEPKELRTEIVEIVEGMADLYLSDQ